MERKQRMKQAQENAAAMEREDELKETLEAEKQQARINNIKNRASLSPSPNKNKVGAGAFEDDE